MALIVWTWSFAPEIVILTRANGEKTRENPDFSGTLFADKPSYCRFVILWPDGIAFKQLVATYHTSWDDRDRTCFIFRSRVQASGARYHVPLYVMSPSSSFGGSKFPEWMCVPVSKWFITHLQQIYVHYCHNIWLRHLLCVYTYCTWVVYDGSLPLTNWIFLLRVSILLFVPSISWENHPQSLSQSPTSHQVLLRSWFQQGFWFISPCCCWVFHWQGYPSIFAELD